MLDSIDRLGAHIADRTEEDFATNAMLQDAVVRQLGILGEAARSDLAGDLRSV